MTPPTAQVLEDPRVRLAAGAAVLLVTAAAARRNRVGPGEAAMFRAVNDMPGWLYPPAWVVMQAGTLGAGQGPRDCFRAPAAAAASRLAWDTCPGTPAWPSPWAPPPSPGSGRAGGP
jgi:hypothetical protein